MPRVPVLWILVNTRNDPRPRSGLWPSLDWTVYLVPRPRETVSYPRGGLPRADPHTAERRRWYRGRASSYPLESWNLFHDRDQEPQAPASLRRRIVCSGPETAIVQPRAGRGTWVDRATLERDAGSSGRATAEAHCPDPDAASACVQAQPPLEPGDQLGRYRLLERLGRGGQGDVWKAMRREPFVELYGPEGPEAVPGPRPRRMAQFRREAERGGRLAGPSLLTGLRARRRSTAIISWPCPTSKGSRSARSSRARIAHLAGKPNRGDPSPRDPRRARLSAGHDPDPRRRRRGRLARAHDQRIAHRDIKPANILLDNRRPEGVYLCDFGLGRDLEIATPEQMRDGAGTPMYMAPERLLRATADEISATSIRWASRSSRR